MPYRDAKRQVDYMRAWRVTRRQQTQSLHAQAAALCDQAQQARTPAELALLIRPLCTLLLRLVESGSLRPAPGGVRESRRA